MSEPDQIARFRADLEEAKSEHIREYRAFIPPVGMSDPTEIRRAYQRDTWARRKTIRNLQKRIRRLENPATVNRERVYRKVNRDNRLASIKKRRQKNPEAWQKEKLKYNKSASARSSRRLVKAKRRAQKKASSVSAFTAADWRACLEAFANACAYCGEGLGGSPTMDHFVPLSKGGAHGIHNIMPACRRCNTRKSARDPFAFLHDTRPR